MNKLYQHILQFRKAIDSAKNNGEFDSDNVFRRFPHNCCGDASTLLAHYLLEFGIQTYYVCGCYYGENDGFGQSHAWLELLDGTIIDITGDQFKFNEIFQNYNLKVYVGKNDVFHKMFQVSNRDIIKSEKIEKLGDFCYPRLKKLYDIIIRYVE